MPSVEPRAGRVGIYCHLNQMQRELAIPFKVLPATVKRNQLHFGQSVSEWYSALPRAAKGGRGQLKEQVSLLMDTWPASKCQHLHWGGLGRGGGLGPA